MLASLLFAVSRAEFAPAPIKIRDYRSLVSLGSPQVSPDGRWVAVVKSLPNFKTDKRVTSIVLVATGSGEMRALTDGSKSVSSPRWSPSGDRLAFLAPGAEHADEVFVSPIGHGPARQITHAKNGVQQFSWSPTGDRIAYVTPDDDPGNPAIDLFDLNDVGFLTNSRPLPSHIWLTPAEGGKARRLTHGTWSVLETEAPFLGLPSDPSWSPDGKSIAFARQANPFNSASDQTTVATVTVATGEVRAVTSQTSYEYQPAFSTSRPEIAYLRPHGPTPLSAMDLAFAGGAGETPTGPDLDVNGFAWTLHGQAIVASANVRVRNRLLVWRSGRFQALELGDLSVGDFGTNAAGSIAFVGSTGTTPPELYYQARFDGPCRQLTHLNDALTQFALGQVTEYNWTSPDGEKCDGVLTYPVGYQPGQRVPLIVWCHGGPEEAARAEFCGFEGDYLRQTFAGQGYAFFQPNYRGSDNLGNAHEHAIYRDPGEGPARDVLAGVDTLVASGLADPRRLTIAGHSYGGYMTTWLIAHDHRWRSAIVADGAVDWRETYDLTSDGNLAWARDSLGGTPMDPASADLYRTGSPITYADQITTPTFIISGTADQTVPITESYELYHALKDRHIPVRFVGVPGAHHTPDSPNQYEQFYTWMAKWIKRWDP